MATGKQVGRLFGTVAGKAIRAGADAIAGATGSKFVEEVGAAAEQMTVRTGDVLGRAADGLGGTTRGLVAGDQAMTRDGLQEVGGAMIDVAVGTVQGIIGTAEQGATIVHCLRSGDVDSAHGAAREMAVGLVAGAVAPNVACSTPPGNEAPFQPKKPKTPPPPPPKAASPADESLRRRFDFE